MKYDALIAALPAKKAAVYTFDRGQTTAYPYPQVAKDVARATQTLRQWGLGRGSRIGIFAPNGYHWLVYDLAMIGMGAISVPFTDDFAGKIDRALLDQYKVSLLLISQKSGAVPKENFVAFMDAENENVTPLAQPPDPDDDALTMVFSSGSAGGLKGLLVSRKGMEATTPPIVEAIGIEADDRLLLYLPMSNFQQRTMYYASLWRDCDIVITDYLQLPAALRQVHPTVLIAPPMYFQMIHAQFKNFSPLKKNIWKALAMAISWLPSRKLRRSAAERLFPEFHQQFGGKMRVLVTGMAPIKPDVAQLFDWMQLPLCETYGMMEAGSLTYRPAHSKKYASVGKPLREVGIEFTEDGEIIIQREHFLTKNYFQCAEGESERTFIGPNRIATGDIGRLDSEGYLYLFGRKKELIVTPGGYKIHPESVESELIGCPDVAQAAVFSKRGSATLTCVIALNSPGDEEACQRVKEFARKMKTTKAAPITEFIFSDGLFSAANGMLRPNLKLDRRNIAAKYHLV